MATDPNSRDGVQNAYAAQMDRIRRNQMLSGHARRVLAAKAYTEFSAKLDELREKELVEVERRRGELTRRMFGHAGTADPSTVVSRRDAADRAARIDDPREALAALSRAERDGDEHLAQAIAARGSEYGWDDVVGGYAASRPRFVEDARAFNELPNPNDTLWKLRHAAEFVVPVPEELAGVQGAEVQRLAQVDLQGEQEVA